jgi:hypothetical protein
MRARAMTPSHALWRGRSRHAFAVSGTYSRTPPDRQHRHRRDRGGADQRLQLLHSSFEALLDRATARWRAPSTLTMAADMDAQGSPVEAH